MSMLRPITVAMTTNSVRTAAFSISMYACDRPDGKDARLLGVKYTPYWPNNRHDAYIDTVLFEFDEIMTPYLMLVFTSGSKVYLDTILL
jgi:hypothetical protein